MPTELELLKTQLAELAERIARLESSLAAASSTATPLPKSDREAAVSSSGAPELSSDIVIVISAAVAAYLGERAHIRSIRLVGTSRWSHQGRLSIQGSHSLQ
jgi:methylmalonyl-CoA carboxyltransferase large subunit